MGLVTLSLCKDLTFLVNERCIIFGNAHSLDLLDVQLLYLRLNSNFTLKMRLSFGILVYFTFISLTLVSAGSSNQRLKKSISFPVDSPYATPFTYREHVRWFEKAVLVHTLQRCQRKAEDIGTAIRSFFSPPKELTR
jgi:hypothetical protein